MSETMSQLDILKFALEGARQRTYNAAYNYAHHSRDDRAMKRLKESLGEYDEIAEMVEKCKADSTPECVTIQTRIDGEVVYQTTITDAAERRSHNDTG